VIGPLARLKESSSWGPNLSHAEPAATSDYLPKFGYSNRQPTLPIKSNAKIYNNMIDIDIDIYIYI
jgi:hypothetical protein